MPFANEIWSAKPYQSEKSCKINNFSRFNNVCKRLGPLNHSIIKFTTWCNSSIFTLNFFFLLFSRFLLDFTFMYDVVFVSQPFFCGQPEKNMFISLLNNRRKRACREILDGSERERESDFGNLLLYTQARTHDLRLTMFAINTLSLDIKKK